jgi:hypothetical protein
VGDHTEYVVEEIVDVCKRWGRLEFLVKWELVILGRSERGKFGRIWRMPARHYKISRKDTQIEWPRHKRLPRGRNSDGEDELMDIIRRDVES